MSKALLKQLSLTGAIVLGIQPLWANERQNPYPEFNQVNINGLQIQNQQQHQFPAMGGYANNPLPWMQQIPQNQIIQLQPQVVMTPTGAYVIYQTTHQVVHPAPQYLPFLMGQNQPGAMANFPGNYPVDQQVGIQLMPLQLAFNPSAFPQQQQSWQSEIQNDDEDTLQGGGIKRQRPVSAQPNNNGINTLAGTLPEIQKTIGSYLPEETIAVLSGVNKSAFSRGYLGEFTKDALTYDLENVPVSYVIKILENSCPHSLSLLSVSDDSLRELLPLMASLKNLKIKGNCDFAFLTEEGAAALAQSTVLKNLTSLTLKYNKIGVAGAQALGQSTAWPSLTSLNLKSNNIGAAGAKALGQSTAWPSLTSLNLKSNNIGATGAQALGQSTAWPSLTSLDLEDNYIGAAGAEALGRSTAWPSLTSLYLEDNYIGAAGAETLGQSTAWPSLTSLDLRGNNIGAAGAQALGQSTAWPSLTSLDLRGNNIGAAGAQALGQSTAWPSLTSLDLWNNNIGAAGAQALGRSTAWPSLTSLNLGGNNIGDAGAAALGQSTAWPSLTSLSLWHNEIGAAGAEALGQSTAWPSLTSLNLGLNNIENDMAGILRQRFGAVVIIG